MPRHRPARPTDWKIKQFPEERVTIDLRRDFSTDELEQIRFGVIPEEMEDKWFIYWEDDALFFHRSWTGTCLYVVRFSCHENGATMISADINRDRGEYKNTDDSHDATLIPYLIDALLLRKPAAFPSESASKSRAALEQWSLLGQAGLGIHPGDKREPRILIKSRCHLCKHKFRGHPGCMAFPVHLPHDLAIGNRMHDEEYPGDRGYRFVERSDAPREQCPHLYKGKKVVIPLERVLKDAFECVYDAEPSVDVSYKEFLRYFERLERITPHELVIGASFAYSWMRRTLTFKGIDTLEDVAAYVESVRLENDLDGPSLKIIQKVVNRSMIGTSKLLHFINPERYAIYDSWVDTYLYGTPSYDRQNDSDHFMSYTCACRRAVKDKRFKAVHQHVNTSLGYDVTELRALELVMFLTAKAQGRK